MRVVVGVVAAALMCALASEAGAATWDCQAFGHRYCETGKKCEVAGRPRVDFRMPYYDGGTEPDGARLKIMPFPGNKRGIYVEWGDNSDDVVTFGYCVRIKARR